MQLQMFMTPQEILKTIEGCVDGESESTGRTLERKLEEAEDESWYPGDVTLAEDVATNGVRVPIVIYHNDIDYDGKYPYGILLGNGHHRMAAALSVSHLKQVFVPVAHSSHGDFFAHSFMESCNSDYDRYA